MSDSELVDVAQKPEFQNRVKTNHAEAEIKYRDRALLVLIVIQG